MRSLLWEENHSAAKEAQGKGSWAPRKTVSENFPDEVLSKETLNFTFQRDGVEHHVN